MKRLADAVGGPIRFALGLWLVMPFTARAFTVNTGFAAGCHEQLTIAAFERGVLDLPLSGVAVPDDDTWREFAAFLSDQLAAPGVLDTASVSDQKLFLLTSFLIGVRAPDTDGHSFLNLAAIRELHSDPSPEGQYLHALRGPADDGADGNLAAVAGTRARVEGLMAEALRLLQLPAAQQTISGAAYLDFYGRFELSVHGPSYHMGQALHIVQDSFSHAIRDEAGGYRQIVHVMNYVEAIGGTIEEHRDGLAHSDSLDDCRAEPGEPGGTVGAAIDASTDLILAFRVSALGSDRDAVVRFLDKWVTLKTGCEVDTGLCGNERWLAVARKRQTRPYVETLFSCASGSGRGRAGLGGGLVLAFGVFGLLLVRRLRGTGGWAG